MTSHREIFMMSTSNTTANRYGSIAAEIYDIDKPFHALRDTAFYLGRLSDHEGPILEPACGTGRALVPILEAGLDVTGFDASAEMLGVCRTRCAERRFSPSLSQQSFEQFHYDREFSAIVVPVASFCLIDDFATALGVLGRFRDHLRVGGLLMLDIQPLSAMAGAGGDRRSWTAGNGDLLTVMGDRQKVDWLAQREEHHNRYERWREGALIESQLEPMALRYWSKEEFAFALRDAGFGDIQVFGNYDRGRAPRSGDRILTFEALRI